MLGKTISHYNILEKLGEGGMGVVYKAQDTKLKRTVALKFLTSKTLGSKEEKSRFVNEAQAAAALDHPNICTVHEIDEANGQTFIAMAYIEGLSLKAKIESGPLKLDEALELATQVAEGLQEAHDKGIVHRDIKNANIMITSRGQAKIMDFGLAKIAKGRLAAREEMKSGIVAYMSPEQASGETIDLRTDVWSLGVVLYEMVAGQLPFKGNYNEAVIYSILNEEPEPVTGLRTGVPRDLERILNKALAKSPDERYQQINDMLVDLRSVRKQLKAGVFTEETARAKPQPSIAVLPFANLSPDKEQDYFCDGMAEEIINALTQVEGLRVVARTSAFSFRGKKIDIREIGRKLNVDKLLEGSVRKAGNQVRITAQLVNVSDGYHLWSEKYDRNIGELCCPEDIFVIQDEISMAMVEELKGKLLKKEKAAIVKRHTENMEAYNLYLKGRHFWNKRTEESLRKSIECFKEAIKKDPGYALAYAGLADSYTTLRDYTSVSPQEVYPKAKEAVRKALEIDDTLAEAHTSLAQLRFREWDFVSAEKEFHRAIQLNPGYATAHHWYALHLMYLARFDQALAEMKKAQELDPLSLVITRNLALVLYFARDYEQASEELKKTLEMDPSFSMTHTWLACVYLQKGMHKEAFREVQKESDIHRHLDPQVEASKGRVYARMGKEGEARKILDDLLKRAKDTYVPPILLADLHFALGEKDQGFQWLKKGYEERDSTLPEIKVEPGFDCVRSDPRFAALLKKMGLEK